MDPFVFMKIDMLAACEKVKFWLFSAMTVILLDIDLEHYVGVI